MALALCISGVRGRLLWLWNSSCDTHSQSPWPSVSPGWGALEQLLWYSPSVALALCISRVRGSGTAPVLLIPSVPGPLYLWCKGLWNSSCVTHPQWPSPSVSWGERPFTLVLEQLLWYLPSVALALYISGIRGSGTAPVLLILSGPGPLYLQGEGQFTLALEQLLYYSPSVSLALCISGVRGRLLSLWNSSYDTHPQWPWPSVSPVWGAACSGSGTALVSGWGSRRSAAVRCRSVKRRACWAPITSRF